MHPIVDCHCHIYPEKIAAKAVESIGHFYDIPMSSGGTAADMAKAEREAGITHQIIFSVATKVPQVTSIKRFIAEEVKKYYADKLFSQSVTRNVKLTEAPSFGEPIYYYDKYSKGSIAYTEIAKELISRVL